MDFADLQTYARQRLSIEQNQTITDQELQMYLNMSMATLDTILATEYEDYRVSTYLATVGGQSFIPTPPDFFKLRAVDYGGPGTWVTIYGYMLPERNRFNNPIGNMFAPYGNTAARKVRLMGNKIYIAPSNISSGQYQVWYTPKFQFLVLPTDTLDDDIDQQGFIEYAICSTGVKVYNKLNLPVQGMIDEMKYYEAMVINGAANRMDNGPQSGINVRNIGDWSFNGGSGWGV